MSPREDGHESREQFQEMMGVQPLADPFIDAVYRVYALAERLADDETKMPKALCEWLRLPKGSTYAVASRFITSFEYFDGAVEWLRFLVTDRSLMQGAMEEMSHIRRKYSPPKPPK